MKSKTVARTHVIALTFAVFASACTLFFGSAHHDEARCVQRCRALRWVVAAIAYHGDFASTCVCQPPAGNSATTSAITPANSTHLGSLNGGTGGASGAAIAAAARPAWRNVPFVLP